MLDRANAKTAENGASTIYLFGTLSDYFGVIESYFDVYNTSRDVFPAYSGDFLPYASDYQSYYTVCTSTLVFQDSHHISKGIYSSRAYLKQLSRKADHLLRSAEIAYSFATMKSFASSLENQMQNLPELFIALEETRKQTALIQDHAAITGISSGDVNDYYVNVLEEAIKTNKEVYHSF